MYYDLISRCSLAEKGLPSLQCCIMLVRCGAEVNLTDNSGLTALLIAVRYEYEDILKVLLKYVSILNPIVFQVFPRISSFSRLF